MKKPKPKSTRPTMAVIDTRYALSSGVVRQTGTINTQWGDGKTRVTLRNMIGWDTYLVLGKDCFETEAEARMDFHARRARKIVSLEKQIAKLKTLQFNIKES